MSLTGFYSSTTDTIAAIASASGSGERIIIRLSGPDARQILVTVLDVIPDVSRASRFEGHLRLDELLRVPVVVYFWPNQRSYTGQPAAEIGVPGSPALAQAVLERLLQSGARPARAGEFTLRAFLAGRMDLAQAEAVLGVIDAGDDAELRAALTQLAGGLSGRIQQVRATLLDLLADLEAGLDFVEEDIEFVPHAVVLERLSEATSIVAELLRQANERGRATERLRVVLAGLPNAGKSTLFNALTGATQAIVSNVAGTTRDYLVTPVRGSSLEIDLIDTAGWEQLDSGISGAAQCLRHEQIAQADLIVWCSAADLSTEDRNVDAALRQELQSRRPILHCSTRCDLVSEPAEDRAFSAVDCPVSAVDCPVSAVSGAGLTALVAHIERSLTKPQAGARQLVGSTAARCRSSLQRAHESLLRALNAAESRVGDELISVELRDALEALGEVIGANCTDDILDRIFSRFCIGK